jgi:hypothetical protein
VLEDQEAGLAEFELVLGGRGSLRLGEILGGEPAGRAADPPPPRVAAPAAVEAAAHLSSCVNPSLTATPLLFPMFKFGFDLDLEVGATRSWMSSRTPSDPTCISLRRSGRGRDAQCCRADAGLQGGREGAICCAVAALP